MKSTHKILVPNMLPIHFDLLIRIFKQYGYDMELLLTDSQSVIDEGLKHVHNDTCYPALLVIGQFIDALKSGKYDPERTALLITQTGGGCRASNYIHLLRKALAADFPDVPVISLNFSGLEKDSGFKITASMAPKLVCAVLYGDLLMSLYNQCLPYEKNEGDTKRVLEKWQEELARQMQSKQFLHRVRNYKKIIADFDAIEKTGEKKPKVGIVGEIYVKYSPLANNNLEKFLISEGCEPVLPGLLDFCMYCTNNGQTDSKLYNYSDKGTFFNNLAHKLLYHEQKKLIRVIKENSSFMPPHDFNELRHEADILINQGVKMGEGWLIPAEMGALVESGVENIVCTQPFGCLPNHIVAKGMARIVKEKHPDANIVAIDYDPGATKINQENRIKLMLANAKRD